MLNRVASPEEQLSESELDMMAVHVICQSHLHASKDIDLATEKMYERYVALQRKQAWSHLDPNEEAELQEISQNAKKEEDRILAEKGLTDKHSTQFVTIKENLQRAWSFHYAAEPKKEKDTSYIIRQRIASYMAGIDITQPVKIIKIPKGTLLGQYRSANRHGIDREQEKLVAGRWFSFIKKDDGRTAVRPHTEYGISSLSPTDILKAWQDRNKHPSKELFVYSTEDEIEGLQTVAAAIADTFSYEGTGRANTKGGAPQVFIDSRIDKMKRDLVQEEIVNKERRSVPRIVRILRRNVERVKMKKDSDKTESLSDEALGANQASDSSSDKNVKMDEVKLDKTSPETKDEWNIDTLKVLVDNIMIMEDFYKSEGEKTHIQDLNDLVALAKGLLASAETKKENVEPYFEALVLILRHEFDRLHQQKLQEGEQRAITTNGYLDYLKIDKGHHYARMISLILKDVYKRHDDIYKNHPEADKKFPRQPFKELKSLEVYDKHQAQYRHKKLAEDTPKILFDPRNANMSFHGFYNKKTHDIIVAPMTRASSSAEDADMMGLNKSDLLYFDLIPNEHGSFYCNWPSGRDRVPVEVIEDVNNKILSWGPIQPFESAKAKRAIGFLAFYFNAFTQKDGTQPFKDTFSIILDEKEKVFRFEFTKRPYSSDDKKLMRKLLFDAMHVQPKHGFSLFNKDATYSEDFFEQNGCKTEHGSPVFTLQIGKLTRSKDFNEFMDKHEKTKIYSPHRD